MKYLSSLMWAEFLKFRKSKVIWITFLAFSMLPLMGGFFMYILKNPSLAQQAGLIGAKAQLAGSADWPSYMMLLAQGIALGGLFIFGFITSWIFGREFSDNTVKDLLALPFPRIMIAIAKFNIIGIWSIVLSLWVIALGFVIGCLVGLPLWSTSVLQEGMNVLLVTTLLTILLSTPVGWIACYGRGYLAPLGFIILTMVFSQIIASIGYGRYFPWSIPALFSNVTGVEGTLPLTSLFIVLVTALTGFVSTLGFWRFSDQDE
ncbi:ABC transporter permease [Halobacillus sp. BBL2006]|uniref:ABC transporter permease n=1 Tax=Halobacillus sp. BBL2006 TaxID=1543706 RepID=UPI0005424806|nr:ABC transporter permease [Halobacillus sp. BBL2006]KHE72702.1 hypothetical protein LD39_03150 [Halobacillus sp. BBL2006]